MNGLEGLVPAAYLAIDEDESDDEQDKDTLNGSIDLGRIWKGGDGGEGGMMGRVTGHAWNIISSKGHNVY